MEFRDLTIVFSAVSAIIAITTALSTGLYAFAVLRTRVAQLDSDNQTHWAHANNAEIHFNSKAFIEFEKRIEIEIKVLQRQVTEVKDYCEDIDKKLDERTHNDHRRTDQ